tara:strand:- start:994 stop:1719 length:726 start_codon:yes stop_codon:yes gene_type:complete
MNKRILKFIFLILLFLFSLSIIFFLYNDKNIQNELTSFIAILKQYSETHLINSLIIYSIVVIFSVALSLPVTAISMIASGYFFSFLGVIISLICVSMGSFGPYFIAKYFTNSILYAHALKYVKKIRKNLNNTKFNYYICLRLFPLIPFPIVSAIGGILNLSYRSYFFNTLIGVLPSCIALNLIGLQVNEILILDENIITYLLKEPAFFITLILVFFLFVLPPIFLRKNSFYFKPFLKKDSD